MPVNLRSQAHRKLQLPTTNGSISSPIQLTNQVVKALKLQDKKAQVRAVVNAWWDGHYTSNLRGVDPKLVSTVQAYLNSRFRPIISAAKEPPSVETLAPKTWAGTAVTTLYALGSRSNLPNSVVGMAANVASSVATARRYPATASVMTALNVVPGTTAKASIPVKAEGAKTPTNVRETHQSHIDKHQDEIRAVKKLIEGMDTIFPIFREMELYAGTYIKMFTTIVETYKESFLQMITELEDLINSHKSAKDSVVAEGLKARGHDVSQRVARSYEAYNDELADTLRINEAYRAIQEYRVDDLAKFLSSTDIKREAGLAGSLLNVALNAMAKDTTSFDNLVRAREIVLLILNEGAPLEKPEQSFFELFNVFPQSYTLGADPKNLELLRKLIDAGLNIDHNELLKGVPFSKLEAAISIGDLSLVKLLIQLGADVLYTTVDNGSLFEMAESAMRPDIVDALVSAKTHREEARNAIKSGNLRQLKQLVADDKVSLRQLKVEGRDLFLSIVNMNLSTFNPDLLDYFIDIRASFSEDEKRVMFFVAATCGNVETSSGVERRP